MKIPASFTRKILVYILLQTAVVSSLTLVAWHIWTLRNSSLSLIGIIILIVFITMLTAYKVGRIVEEGLADRFANLNRFSEYIRQIAETLWNNAKSLDKQAALVREYGDRQTALAEELNSIITDVPSGTITDESYDAPQHHTTYTQKEEASK